MQVSIETSMSYLSTNFLLKYIFSDSMQLWNKMVKWFMIFKKKVKIKYLKASKKLDFSTNSIWSRSRLFVSYYAPHSVHCNVCNVTLFWHHLDILLSSSAHQIRHIYLVKCLIMFLLPKSIYYLVAPRLWSLMLFKKNGTPITLKDSIVVSTFAKNTTPTHSPYFSLALHRTKVRWRFRKILWPSQNI